jgi:hypothetical protein
MRRLLAFCLVLACLPRQVMAQAEPPYITSPLTGQAVQGVVTITGTSEVVGFVRSEVAFTYADNPTDTWFLIAASDLFVTDGTLAVWDTTTITDGVYVLRLRVFLPEGYYLDAVVSDVRVRNYSPIETPTPTATPVIILPTLTPTITPLPPATPTPLPPNPVAMDRKEILISLGVGALLVLLFFLFFGLYARFRR